MKKKTKKNKKNKTKQNTEILMNKLLHLGLSILELSKMLMYEFRYDYVKQKYGEKVKLCYMDSYYVIQIVSLCT